MFHSLHCSVNFGYKIENPFLKTYSTDPVYLNKAGMASFLGNGRDALIMEDSIIRPNIGKYDSMMTKSLYTLIYAYLFLFLLLEASLKFFPWPHGKPQIFQISFTTQNLSNKIKVKCN